MEAYYKIVIQDNCKCVISTILTNSKERTLKEIEKLLDRSDDFYINAKTLTYDEYVKECEELEEMEE